MKICPICKKEHDKKSNYCHRNCQKKSYYNKTKKIPRIIHKFCQLCGKERELRTHIKTLCRSCSYKDYRSRMHPQVRENYLKGARNRHRIKKGISLDVPLLKRKNGSGCINQQGYKILNIKGHPNSRNKTGSVAEHVFVMGNYLGRPLKKHELVHHKNGDRLDNRIENLELWSKAHPPGQRVEDKIRWCKEFLEQYGYIVIMKENQH